MLPTPHAESRQPFESGSRDRERLDELWVCIGHDDAYVRRRAIDSFEKVVNRQPTWADPYVPRIVDELTASERPPGCWPG